jgi:hypothetical protein
MSYLQMTLYVRDWAEVIAIGRVFPIWPHDYV